MLAHTDAPSITTLKRTSREASWKNGLSVMETDRPGAAFVSADTVGRDVVMALLLESPQCERRGHGRLSAGARPAWREPRRGPRGTHGKLVTTEGTVAA